MYCSVNEQFSISTRKCFVSMFCVHQICHFWHIIAIDSVSLFNCCPWKTHKLFKCIYTMTDDKPSLYSIFQFISYWNFCIRFPFFFVRPNCTKYVVYSLRIILNVFVEGEKTQMKNKQTESELFDFCLNWHGWLPSPSFPCMHANGRIYAKVSQNSKLNDK